MARYNLSVNGPHRSVEADPDTPLLFRVAYTESDSPVPRGYYRSMAPGATNFVLECFLNEIARAAGKDPLAYRRSRERGSGSSRSGSAEKTGRL
jgi:isoquinoline 1-oxidoreductase subunit beta